jgi:phytoene dehydrogenase-like protein
VSDQKKERNKIMKALAVGAALGAGIALLFSPRKGREFRAQLREGSTSFIEYARSRTRQSRPTITSEEEPKPSLSVKAKQSDYDVVIVGGGHNGLVTAAYLAKAGHKVLVLEKKEMVGGTAVTEELIPGYKFSTLADGAGYLAQDIIDDLKLPQHGLQILPVDPLIFAPQPDGRQLTIWQDTDRTAQEIAKFSRADAEAYPLFIDLMSKISQVVRSLKNMTPPDLPSVGLGDMLELLNMANTMRGLGRKNIAQVIRIMPMPIADLLNEWFESDEVKGAIAASAVNNISWGPQEAGTAYTLLYNWSGSNNGLFRSSGQVKGGMGALTQALAKAARSYGSEIITNAEVVKINLQGGDATEVTRANGDVISAGVIVSGVDMRTTFMKLIEPYYLDQTVVKHVQNIKYRGTTARVHFTLNKLPSFMAANGNGSSLLRGHIQIAPTMTYLQKAYDPVKYGAYSKKPYLDIQIPTLTDKSLAPAGKHIMSVTVKYMPYHLRESNWNELSDTIGQLVKETIAEYAPDFESCVEECQVITALDMETEYGLPEGNPAHGEMTLDQFVWMRPIPGYAQYRAPVDGLYMCSAATHPGGGITGLNGKNAAREILKDWK